MEITLVPIKGFGFKEDSDLKILTSGNNQEAMMSKIKPSILLLVALISMGVLSLILVVGNGPSTGLSWLGSTPTDEGARNGEFDNAGIDNVGSDSDPDLDPVGSSSDPDLDPGAGEGISDRTSSPDDLAGQSLSPETAGTAETEAEAGDGDAASGGPGSGQVVIRHVVAPGDTLWDLASKYDVDTESIAIANDLRNLDRLRPGQELRIPPGRGVIHTVRRGETLGSIAQRYRVSLDAISGANNVDPLSLQIGAEVFVPGARMPRTASGEPGGQGVQSTARIASGDRDSSRLAWPLRGKITSGFGMRIHPIYKVPLFHKGIDIQAATGTPIKAAAGGKVIEAGRNGGYGLTIVIDHGNGMHTRYSHASRILVTVGQEVQQGEVIARVGSTGLSTGPHLDLEVLINGKNQNPLNYLPN